MHEAGNQSIGLVRKKSAQGAPRSPSMSCSITDYTIPPLKNQGKFCVNTPTDSRHLVVGFPQKQGRADLTSGDKIHQICFVSGL